MNGVDFVNALQGFFEIRGDNAAGMTSEQRSNLQKMLDRVEKGQGPGESKAQELVVFAKYAFASVKSPEGAKAITDDLKNLTNIFSDEINASIAAEDQKNKPPVQQPNKPSPLNYPPGVRC